MGFKSLRELNEQPTFTIKGRTVKAPTYTAALEAVEQREAVERLTEPSYKCDCGYVGPSAPDHYCPNCGQVLPI